MTRDAATVFPDWTCFNALFSRLLLVTRASGRGFSEPETDEPIWPVGSANACGFMFTRRPWTHLEDSVCDSNERLRLRLRVKR